jgi:hypothetical protein
MLALAMEVASRNELTIAEAKWVLTDAMPVSSEQADQILSELLNTILLRLNDKIAFQMHSYGEYLVAEEMEEYTVPSIQEFIYLPESQIPNQSWTNVLSYLVETHSMLRRYLVHHHPEMILTASQSAFSRSQKNDVLLSILDSLAEGRVPLIGHPSPNLTYLSRFITDDTLARLADDAASSDVVRSSNALVLLGQAKVTSSLDRAFEFVENPSLHYLLRRAGISAIANVGDFGLIPRLKNNESNRNKWKSLYGINLFDGQRYQIAMSPTAKQDKVIPESFRIVLKQYLGKAEVKSLAPDGTPCTGTTQGLLLRAKIVAGKLVPVGKETDRKWEHGGDPSMLDSQVHVYGKQRKMVVADAAERKRWSAIGVRRLMRESKLSQPPVSNAIKGKPVRPRTLAIIRQTAARIVAE